MPCRHRRAPRRFATATQIFSSTTITRDIQYGSAPEQVTGDPVALKLDLYQPTGDTATKRPVLVYVHGGGYSGGDKATVPAVDFAQNFARARLRRGLDQLPPDLTARLHGRRDPRPNA